MIIGLTLTNLIRPGVGASLSGSRPPPPPQKSISELLIDLIPRSIGEPFTQNHLAQLVVLTLVLGIGLVKIRDAQKAKGERSFQVVVDLLTIGFELLMKVLLWVVALSPLAVFGVVASVVGQQEAMAVLKSLIALIGVVALGLALQVTWYLVQMMIVAGMSPCGSSAGHSTSWRIRSAPPARRRRSRSRLRSLGRLGVSRRSSQLTACIGTNFNNDGTALYQATAVLFIAQAWSST